jgi:hypothetical protein
MRNRLVVPSSFPCPKKDTLNKPLDIAEMIETAARASTEIESESFGKRSSLFCQKTKSVDMADVMWEEEAGA